MNQVAIIGVGIHPFGRFPGKSYVQIAREAVDMALQDAGMSFKQVNQSFCSRVFLPGGTGATVLSTFGRLGSPIVDVECACASGGAAVSLAMRSIQLGVADVVLCFGVEKMEAGFMPPVMHEDWQIKTGLSQNPVPWAILARRHMETYGTTETHLAKVSVKNHRHAVHNPYAMYRKELTIEEVLASRLINDPLRLLELCAPNEGAAALVISSLQVARRYRNDPITIAASVHETGAYPLIRAPGYSFGSEPDYFAETPRVAKRAYNDAGVGPEDLSLVELQDTDAFSEILYTEQLGLCAPGEGPRLLDEGATQIGGRIPVSASGGLLSKGEPVGASGLGQIVDAVFQLRGQAGPRQVANAKVALTHVTGALGNCAINILKK